MNLAAGADGPARRHPAASSELQIRCVAGRQAADADIDLYRPPAFDLLPGSLLARIGVRTGEIRLRGVVGKDQVPDFEMAGIGGKPTS